MEVDSTGPEPHSTISPSASVSDSQSQTSQSHAALGPRPPRVGHKKSRNGCAQCKRRHVKCNEAIPCSNCVRHGVPCSLAGGPYVRREDAKDRRPTQHRASISSSHSIPTATPTKSNKPATLLSQQTATRPSHALPSSTSSANTSLPSNQSAVSTPPHHRIPVSNHAVQQQPHNPAAVMQPPQPPLNSQTVSMRSSLSQSSQTAPSSQSSGASRANVSQVSMPTPPQDSPAAQNNRQTSPFAVLNDLITRPAQPTDANKAWLMDIQLMHHWMSYTAAIITMPNIEGDLHIWQSECPKLGFEFDYMLYGMLGTAALHKAFLEPDSANVLQTVAVKHMDKSLSAHRMDTSPTNAKNANSRFLFTWNILVMAYSIPNHNRPLEAIIELMGLARGVDAMLAETWMWVSQGPFAHTLTKGIGQPSNSLPPDLPDMGAGLDQLERMMNVEPITDDDKRILHLVINDLKAVYESAITQGAHTTFASMICWPKQEPAAYCNLLRRRLSQALVIMAFYCVLLDLLDAKWWLHGWGRRVLQDIIQILPQRWHHWIEGPVQSLLLRNGPPPHRGVVQGHI